MRGSAGTAERLVFAIAHEIGNHLGGIRLQAHLLDEDLDAHERFRLTRELGDRFVEASGNPVLQMIRRGMKTQFMDRLPVAKYSAPQTIRPPHLHRLRHALESRDGAAASEAIYELTRAIRKHTLDSITAERNLRAAAGSRNP